MAIMIIPYPARDKIGMLRCLFYDNKHMMIIINY